MTSNLKRGDRGSALLAVLWLSAALAAIAFSVATTVRSETERASTDSDALRCYYLASGAIQRALLHIQWGGKYYVQPQHVMHFDFPSGEADVELIPENSRLNINAATSADLLALMSAERVPPDRAGTIVGGILDWRTPAPGGEFTDFDQYYLSLKPAFRARHSSFEEIEELLLVRGVTPDLFYGRYERGDQGQFLPIAGLKDCLSVYGGVGPFDANSVQPELMRAIGVGAAAIKGIVDYRRATLIKSVDQIQQFNDGSPGFARLTVNVFPVATLRATARLRLPNGQWSEVRRSVAALVRFLTPDFNPPYHIMRWYDNAFVLQ